MVEAAGLRASHADRDRVVDVLSASAADGRLGLEDMDERVTAALSARTRGELAAPTADLPVTAGGVEGKDEVRIAQQGGSIRRGEGWEVPRRLEIESRWGAPPWLRRP